MNLHHIGFWYMYQVVWKVVLIFKVTMEYIQKSSNLQSPQAKSIQVLKLFNYVNCWLLDQDVFT